MRDATFEILLKNLGNQAPKTTFALLDYSAYQTHKTKKLMTLVGCTFISHKT